MTRQNEDRPYSNERGGLIVVELQSRNARVERTERLLAPKKLEEIAILNGCNAGRRSRINQIALAETVMLRDIINDHLQVENHIVQVAALRFFPVANKAELYPLCLLETRERNERRHHRRS